MQALCDPNGAGDSVRDAPEGYKRNFVLLVCNYVTFGAGLAYASKKFAVETDPRVTAVLGALPGANCGGCGYPGCAGYADAVVSGVAAPNLCTPGGPDAARKIGEILGISEKAVGVKLVRIKNKLREWFQGSR